MSNPNNCATCNHKHHPDGGWCYMFRDEPKRVCFKHTARMSIPGSAGMHAAGAAGSDEQEGITNDD